MGTFPRRVPVVFTFFHAGDKSERVCRKLNAALCLTPVSCGGFLPTAGIALECKRDSEGGRGDDDAGQKIRKSA